jgi:hypothetical protein
MKRLIYFLIIFVALITYGNIDAKRYKAKKEAPASCQQYLDRLEQIEDEIWKLKKERHEVNKQYQECYKSRDKSKELDEDKELDEEKPEKEKKEKKGKKGKKK